MISATQAQQLLRKRMVEISHTSSEAGILNYGSLVVQPHRAAAVQPHRAAAVQPVRAAAAQPVRAAAAPREPALIASH
jgi:hypothetical protein